MDRSTGLVGENLQAERMPDGTRRLLRDLVYRVKGELVNVPADTCTDFSTIPWPGRWLVEWNRVDLAGVIHDYMYQTGVPDRARADEAWRLVAMNGQHRANAFQAWTGWIVLRLGGRRAWDVWRARRRDQPAEMPGKGLKVS